jgi:hypothetical protein
MELIIVLVAIPFCIIFGYLITKFSESMWFGWLRLLLWKSQKPLLEPETPTYEMAEPPPTHLPTPTEVKRREDLLNLDTTDPQFQTKFQTWMEEADGQNQRRDPHVPRFTRTASDDK